MAGALGSIVSNAVDAYQGKSGTNLQQFLQKFGSSAGRYVDTLDPIGTFDVKIRFYPSATFKELDNSFSAGLERVGQSLLNSAKQAGANLLDNATGGLFSSLTEGGAGSVVKQRKDFKEKGKHSFMEYLAKANLMQCGEQWQSAEQAGCPLELELGLYVQDITVPKFSVGGASRSGQGPFGDFPVPGMYISPDGGFSMNIVNTKAALHERIFYPWMRETTLPYWSYESQPYTTATITIDWTKHNDCKYVFLGCRPIEINMMQANQQAGSENLTRQVMFAYDFMFVTSDLNVNDSVGSKLMGAVGSLAGGAGKMLNF